METTIQQPPNRKDLPMIELEKLAEIDAVLSKENEDSDV